MTEIDVLVKRISGGGESAGEDIQKVMRGGPRYAAVVPVLIQTVLCDCDNRLAAISALGRIGPASTPAAAVLMRHMVDEDKIVVAQTIMTIRRIGTGAVPTVTDHLKHRDADTRYAAVTLLKHIGKGQPTVFAGLARCLLCEPEARVRKLILEVVANDKHPSTNLLLLYAAFDSNETVAHFARSQLLVRMKKGEFDKR